MEKRENADSSLRKLSIRLASPATQATHVDIARLHRTRGAAQRHHTAGPPIGMVSSHRRLSPRCWVSPTGVSGNSVKLDDRKSVQLTRRQTRQHQASASARGRSTSARFPGNSGHRAPRRVQVSDHAVVGCCRFTLPPRFFSVRVSTVAGSCNKSLPPCSFSFPALDLLRRRQWQGVDKGDIARRLVIGQLPQAPTDDLESQRLTRRRPSTFRQANTSSPRTGSRNRGHGGSRAPPGGRIRTDSTSTAAMFSPDRRITFFLRSTKNIEPSGSRRTMSPVWNQPSCPGFLGGLQGS